jgi:cyclopropane fatty-acyl-phospholipid synthase-like methyltransferase
MIPKTSTDFDRAYRAPLTLWGDLRIPPEVAALVRSGAPRGVLELGCGVGRLSRYMASQGLRAVGVDFSSVAIAKAQASVREGETNVEFRVGDVTALGELAGPFDRAFDVGCFHCLDSRQQARYACEVARVLAPRATLLIWALDDSPSGMPLSPATIQAAFDRQLRLLEAKPSRRRLARSHWYWLSPVEES